MLPLKSGSYIFYHPFLWINFYNQLLKFINNLNLSLQSNLWAFNIYIWHVVNSKNIIKAANNSKRPDVIYLTPCFAELFDSAGALIVTLAVVI